MRTSLTALLIGGLGACNPTIRVTPYTPALLRPVEEADAAYPVSIVARSLGTSTEGYDVYGIGDGERAVFVVHTRARLHGRLWPIGIVIDDQMLPYASEATAQGMLRAATSADAPCAVAAAVVTACRPNVRRKAWRRWERSNGPTALLPLNCGWEDGRLSFGWFDDRGRTTRYVIAGGLDCAQISGTWRCF